MRSAPPYPTDGRRLNPAAAPWSLRLAYGKEGDSAPPHPLGHFVERGLGMDLHMLGAPGTHVFTAVPPGAPQQAPPTLVLARRDAPATLFTALYAPFENGQPVVHSIEALAETPDAVAVRIRGVLPDGSPLHDIILLAMRDQAGEETTLSRDGTFSASFTGHAVMRPETLQHTGNLREFDYSFQD